MASRGQITDERDERQNRKNIEIILQTFSLCTLFWNLNLEKCSFNHLLCWFFLYIELAPVPPVIVASWIINMFLSCFEFSINRTSSQGLYSMSEIQRTKSLAHARPPWRVGRPPARYTPSIPLPACKPDATERALWRVDTSVLWRRLIRFEIKVKVFLRGMFWFRVW